MVTGDRTFKTSSSNADVGEAVYCTDTGPNNGDVMVIADIVRFRCCKFVLCIRTFGNIISVDSMSF